VSQWEQKLKMNGRRNPHAPYPLAAVPTMSIRKKNALFECFTWNNTRSKGHQFSACRMKMHDQVTLINYFLVQLQGKRTLAETQTHCHTRSCKRVLFFSKINGTFTENKRAFEQ
jgi:hypothetical protein